MTILIRFAGGLDGRVHFTDGEFSSGLITRVDGQVLSINVMVKGKCKGFPILDTERWARS